MLGKAERTRVFDTGVFLHKSPFVRTHYREVTYLKRDEPHVVCTSPSHVRRKATKASVSGTILDLEAPAVPLHRIGYLAALYEAAELGGAFASLRCEDLPEQSACA